jgi:Mg/Co/Ni transporter MgtE
LWIVAGLVVICVAIGLALPWLWRVRERSGVWSVLWRTTTLGALIGFVLAALFGLGGSGEPSAPPMDGIAYAIWFTVVTIVGAVNGVVVGLVALLFRPR